MALNAKAYLHFVSDLASLSMHIRPRLHFYHSTGRYLRRWRCDKGDDSESRIFAWRSPLPSSYFYATSERIGECASYKNAPTRIMCGERKVTTLRTGHRKYSCGCAIQRETHAHFEKNLHSAPVCDRLKPYIPCTVTKSIVCNTCGRTMAHAANFTHSSGIALIPHLLHNILFCRQVDSPELYTKCLKCKTTVCRSIETFPSASDALF